MLFGRAFAYAASFRLKFFHITFARQHYCTVKCQSKQAFARFFDLFSGRQAVSCLSICSYPRPGSRFNFVANMRVYVRILFALLIQLLIFGCHCVVGTFAVYGSQDWCGLWGNRGYVRIRIVADSNEITAEWLTFRCTSGDCSLLNHSGRYHEFYWQLDEVTQMAEQCVLE